MAPRWSRWIPLSGILFVALTLVGLGVGGGVDVNVADEEVLAHFADGGETSADVAGFFITAVGALFFLVFLNSLRARLAAAEGPRGTVAGLVSSAGLASIVLSLGSVVSIASMSAVVEFNDRVVVDPNTVRMIESIGAGFFICAGMVASVLVAGTSVLALRTDVLPSWLAWLGFVVAIALLLSMLWFPWLALLLWVVLVSIAMIVRVPKATNADDAAAVEPGHLDSSATG